MGYYIHLEHGPHCGDPLAGSTPITESEFNQVMPLWNEQEERRKEEEAAAKLAATPLQDLFAAKMEAINQGKNQALDAGFLFTVGEGEEARAVLFDSDAKARLAYLELATKLGQDQAYSTPWKASRGQWVTMDAALFADLQPAYEAHIQACFAWQAEREQELAAAYAAGDRATMEAMAETR